MASFKTALSQEGFRLDGRRPNELRQIWYNIGVYRQADGSAYMEQGNTKVLATIYGPHEVRGPRQVPLHDRAIVNCQFSMAVFSTTERKSRPRGDRRSLEMTRHLETAFRSTIRTSCYPRSQIDIYVEVLEADGSNLGVCVNAATLALVDAGIAMIDLVCACTAASLTYADTDGSVPVIDVNALEQITNVITMSYHPNLEKVAHFEVIGQVHTDSMKDLMNVAVEGCRDIHSILEIAVQERVQQLASSLQSSG